MNAPRWRWVNRETGSTSRNWMRRHLIPACCVIQLCRYDLDPVLAFGLIDERAQVEMGEPRDRLYQPELDEAPSDTGVLRYPALQVPSGAVFPHDGGVGTGRGLPMGVHPDHELPPGSLPGGNRRLVEPNVVSRVPDAARVQRGIPGGLRVMQRGNPGRQAAARGAQPPAATQENIWEGHRPAGP